jgi:A/G-specific adenine glycosylase
VPRAARPRRFGVAFRIEKEGALWLIRRPDTGLLGGMAALPSTPWRDKKWSSREALAHAPVHADWVKTGQVRHAFTHFELTLDVYSASVSLSGDGWWGDAAALPAVFKKAAMKPAQIQTFTNKPRRTRRAAS